MICDLKPYPAMKDSGVPWLGEVPEHWTVLPNRALFVEVKERNHPEDQMLSVTITKGVIPQKTLLSDSSKRDSSNQDKSAYKVVCPGDIAYNKMRAWQGAIGVSDHHGIVSPAYVVQRPRNGAHPRYFHYLLRTPAFAKEAERWSYGITSDMWSLRPEHFKMIYGCFPPFSEQAAIVRFLDLMDRRIRKYVRAKQKLIKLLEEQKQAIIHRAITRGFDANVRLKPSGVEWLGDIPEHWDVVPLRRLLSFGPKNGVSPSPSSTGHVLTMSISAVRDGCIQVVGNEKYVDIAPHTVVQFRIQAGDILLVRGNGSLDLVAKCGIVTDCPENCIYPDILMKLRPNSRILPRFLVHAINSLYVSYQVRGLAKTASGIFKVSGSSVCSFQMIVPPRLEQDDILDFLEHSLLKIDVCRENARREIALLREYLTRLIADVVTGKLDVREAAVRLPDEAEEPELVDEGDAMSAGDDEPVDDLDTVPEEAEA
jgi:type I restriction enzyme S subunit